MPDNITPAEAALLTPRPIQLIKPQSMIVRKEGESNEAFFNRMNRGRKPQAPQPEVHQSEVSNEEYAERLRRAQRRDQSLVEADRERRAQAAINGWKAKVGATFAEATTDRPDVLQRVDRLVTGTGRHQTSMVFYGPLGTGKSWQAYAFISEAMKRGVLTPGQVIAETESILMGDIAAGGFERARKIKDLQEPRNQLFFIDDVGQGYFSKEEARTEAWFGLINHVYNRQLTLLMTTNLKPTENSLGRWIGLRSWDRLLSLLGGPDKFTTLGNVNKRPSVASRNEEQYRSSGRAPQR